MSEIKCARILSRNLRFYYTPFEITFFSQTDWLLVVWFTLFTNFSFFVLNRNISVQIRIMLLLYRIIFVLPRKYIYGCFHVRFFNKPAAE